MGDAPYHVMLIDDDVDMHHVVRLMLPPPVYRVSCCATSAAGKAAMRADPPNALLLDVMLSSPTEGLDLARELKADPQFAPLPIILISSAPLEPGTERPPAGAARFLEKPIAARDLLVALREVLA